MIKLSKKKLWILIVVIAATVAPYYLSSVRSERLLGSITYRSAIDNNKKIALTFDDGPYGKSTERILAILNDKNVKVTFFVTGMNAGKYPEILKEEVAKGHIIGNHSLDHSQELSIKSTKEFLNNVRSAENIINKITGLRPKFFRPPYGLITQDNIQDLASNGYKIILWDNMASDWDVNTSSSQIINRIMKRLRSGSIIVLHDGRDTQVNYPRENMIRALPTLIDRIRQADYNFVGLDELLSQKPYF